MTKSYWFFHRRKELKLNQGSLAERLREAGVDVTQATISAWETGRHNPPMHDPLFRRAFAKALELEIPEMLKMAGYEIESSSNPTEVSDTHMMPRPRLFISSSPVPFQDLRDALAKHLSELFGSEIHVWVSQETINDITELVENGEPIPPLNIDIRLVK
jgi:transcriptional regulator with XRE-family HTH domain